MTAGTLIGKAYTDLWKRTTALKTVLFNVANHYNIANNESVDVCSMRYSLFLCLSSAPTRNNDAFWISGSVGRDSPPTALMKTVHLN